jgi:hypothetical protein
MIYEASKIWARILFCPRAACAMRPGGSGCDDIKFDPYSCTGLKEATNLLEFFDVRSVATRVLRF